ncbi:hypothetical protein [uncultured Traorella sp.]|uniref:hypothetical protein n=1 Tax=uncultured Traorella sp. TaxID=1929048 RepID=UPI0025D703AD|nr:hypothetical protein [uncultured Traorella sp.]
MNSKLDENKQMLYGLVLFVLGLILVFISRNDTGSYFQNFIIGMFMGLGVGMVIVGIVLIFLYIFKKK